MLRPHKFESVWNNSSFSSLKWFQKYGCINILLYSASGSRNPYSAGSRETLMFHPPKNPCTYSCEYSLQTM